MQTNDVITKNNGTNSSSSASSSSDSDLRNPFLACLHLVSSKQNSTEQNHSDIALVKYAKINELPN